MGSRDHRVDAYITKAAPFAQPILAYLRDLVHEAVPQVEEGMKWSRPFFSSHGSPMCLMAAFKQHCSFGFWLHKDVTGKTDEEGMGQFGKLTSLRELPPKKTLLALIRKADALNAGGARLKRPKSEPKPALALPDDVAAQLGMNKHAAARKTYDAFPPSAQREYVEWITEAKTEATRKNRIATMLEWLAEGKRRHWKYE